MSDHQQTSSHPDDGQVGGERQSELTELLEKRRMIQGWLDRLEEQRSTTSEAVLERVRGDYQGRLQETLDALSTHREAISAQLDEARDRLNKVARERSEAGDALEEGHLRHRIGELDDESWDRERVELEGTIERTHDEETRTEGEIERLQDLLTQLGGGPQEPEIEIISDAALFDDETREFPDLGETSASLRGGGTGFLSEIDRALEAQDSDGDAEEQDSLVQPEYPGEPTETAPRPGLKCPECGYTNDADAWFCGVCGADIG